MRCRLAAALFFLASAPALAIEAGMPAPSLSMQALDDAGAAVTTSALKSLALMKDAMVASYDS
jgi:hypothetical protein